MKKINFISILLLLLLSLSNICTAQLYPNRASKNIQWQKCIGGSQNDAAADVVLNTDGSIIVVGNSNSNDGDVSGHHGALNFSDAWIAKLDASGNLLWQKSIGGTGNEGFNKVIATADGNYLCVGSTNSTDGDISFNNGKSDVFVVKIKGDGTVLWSKCFGGTEDDYANNAILTSDGGYAIMGLANSYDGDVQSKPFGNTQTYNWVIKFDGSDNVMWEKVVGPYNSDSSSYYKALPGQGIVETPDKKLMTLTMVTSVDSIYQNPIGQDPGWTYIVHHPGMLTTLNENTGAFIVSSQIVGDGAFTMCSTADRYFVAENITGYIEADYDWGICYDSSIYAFSNKFIGGPSFNVFSSGPVNSCHNNNYYAEPELYSYGTHGIMALSDSIYSTVGASYDNAEFGYMSTYLESPDAWLSKFGVFGGSYEDVFDAAKALPNGNEFVAVGYTNSKDGDVSGLHGSAGGPHDCWIVKIVSANKISGNVFLDKNNNGKKDAGEPPFDNAKINITRKGVTQTAIPNQGYYSNVVDTGTYNTTLSINAPYFTTTNTGKLTTFTAYGSADSIDFPVQVVPGIKDYAVSVTALESARPNVDVEYVITYSNKGTDTLTNRILYFVKDNRTTFGYSTPLPSSISGDTLFWTVTNVIPGGSGNIKFYLKLDPIPLLNIHDSLTSIAYIDSTGDASSSDNKVLLRQIVVGSFDPNDKLESHGGFITPDEMISEKYLTYTIRFQNNGNETANMIVIRDTLDNKLDNSTVEMAACSHPYQFNIQNGKYLSWTFNNINLPDSLSSDSLSKGYITYKVMPLPGFKTGDTIRNTASIYFDFNPPLATNTQLTIFTPEKDTWTGAQSTAWENPLNWSTGKVPDVGVDVYINSGVTNYPVVNSNALCRSINVNPGATITVNTGYKINVGGMFLPH